VDGSDPAGATPSAVQAMVKTAVGRMGGVDILVNNAGIYPVIPITEMTATDFEQVLAVNLKGMFYCSREAARDMLGRQAEGSIINIASIDALHPSSSGMTAYDSSKGGVLMFTKSLAVELGRQGIRVNAVAPGAVNTEGVRSRTAGLNPQDAMLQLREFFKRIALGRMGDSDEIARVVLFLASNMSSYLTGSVIVADGGYLLT